jgi:hypothetical protein
LVSITSTCESLLFLGFRQDFSASSRELVARFGQAGDNPATARRRAFALFLIVALAGAALLGGQLLGKSGFGSAQQGGNQDGA